MSFLKHILTNLMGSNKWGSHHSSKDYGDSHQNYSRHNNYNPSSFNKTFTAQRDLICSKCNFANPSTASFCQGCGASVVASTLCISCGVSLVPGAKFCGQCGKAI